MSHVAGRRCLEGRRDAELAGAAVVGCSRCLDFGYFMAHNGGLDLAKVREVPRWRESDVFTPLERDVMEYAEAMSVTALAGRVRGPAHPLTRPQPTGGWAWVGDPPVIDGRVGVGWSHNDRGAPGSGGQGC